MKRRQALETLGAISLTPLIASSVAADEHIHDIGLSTQKVQHQETEKIVLGDAHFLSKVNPTATVDQRDLEAQTLEAIKLPTIVKAKERAAKRFKILGGRNIPAEALKDFDQDMDEWAYHYTLMAMNSDTNYPRITHHGYGPPHQWFGMNVLGSRGPCTGENVDNAYSVFPIDGHSRYELHGQRMSPSSGDCPIHIVGNLSMSVNIDDIALRDTKINADGSFVISIGPDAANGRANHLQTTSDSRYVFIRDARMNWDQIPNAYRVYRLDPPDSSPLTYEQKLALATRFIVDDVAANFWFKQMVSFLDDNTVSLPDGSAFWGGQPSQMLGRGHLKLQEDEAFVLTVDPGGAEYHNVILHNWWLMTLNYWSRQSALNNIQAQANVDGTYTYVFSIQDPGVYNWIDTVGLHETLFFIRFQLLPRKDGSYGGTPTADGQLVKLKDIKKHLPASTKWVTPSEREQQLKSRYESFKQRFVV